MRSVLSVSFAKKVSSGLDKLAKRIGRTKSDIVKRVDESLSLESVIPQDAKASQWQSKEMRHLSENDVFKALS